MVYDGDDTNDWGPDNDLGGLWDSQGGALDVRRLARATASVSPDLPVEVAFYDGTGWQPMSVVHLDVRYSEGEPAALLITVARTAP
jgi:hypothetical protein